ncbi:ribonuclease H-like domain-containing protein, partial [Tanacetum coccineum]
MFLSRRKYAAEILERAHMANCNPIQTPVDTESNLGEDVRQLTLSRSSAEAEYRGVANVVAETCWLRNLLLQHQRTKHIEIDIHFVRDLVVAGEWMNFPYLLAVSRISGE